MDDAGRRMFDGQWNRPDSEKIEKELTGIADDCYNQTQNPYSQSLEDEADSESLKLLKKAGYNPHAAIGLLERLGRSRFDEPGFTRALRSHPEPKDRVASLKRAAAAMGIGNQGRLNEERFAPYLDLAGGGW
jgi:predicted Zn-dependent protease